MFPELPLSESNALTIYACACVLVEAGSRGGVPTAGRAALAGHTRVTATWLCGVSAQPDVAHEAQIPSGEPERAFPGHCLVFVSARPGGQPGQVTYSGLSLPTSGPVPFALLGAVS